ncbi:hypothetical protein V1478_009766 [Vespula squamosa]|uniref:Secreted protein n=1 Tax=Vespula squamosa TaxID=30214 RepID=A0ABD2AJJ6_VESSQ
MISSNFNLITFVSSFSTLSLTRSDSRRVARNCKNSPAIDSGIVITERDCFTLRLSPSNNVISSCSTN